MPIGGSVVGYRILAAGAWTTVWSRTLTINDLGFNGLTLVQSIPVSEFSATGGTKIRLTILGGVTEGAETSGMWVGNGGGVDLYDFTGDQVQLLKSGSTTISVPADTEIVTDEINFVKDGVNPLVFAAQFVNAASDNLYRKINTGEGTTFFFNTAIEAALQNKTGYTDASTTGPHMVTKIELFI